MDNMGMNEKQIYWLYNELKYAIRGTQELPLTLETTAQLYDKAKEILDITKKSRELDPEIDSEVTQIIGWFFKIIASAETLNKPL